jgi:hypothetical protein
MELGEPELIVAAGPAPNKQTLFFLFLIFI